MSSLPGGASQPKSVVACSKMKIWKDPYCVDFHLGFTPHSTQWWATPHIFSVNGVTDKAPIPHNSSTFCKYCCRKWAFFVWKHPIPHTFVSFWVLYPYNTHSYKFHPHFVSTRFHTSFPCLTPHSTPNSFRACYSTFWLSRPPGHRYVRYSHQQTLLHTLWCMTSIWLWMSKWLHVPDEIGLAQESRPWMWKFSYFFLPNSVFVSAIIHLKKKTLEL